MTTRSLLPLLIGLVCALPAEASNSNARIALHLAPAGGNGCNLATHPPACSNIITSGSLAPSSYYAYVLVTTGDPALGIAGVAFGIDYDGAPNSGVDVWSWTRCATLEFHVPEWPLAGTGTLVTWERFTNCQRYEPGGFGTGVVAVAGYLYVSAYSPDNLAVTPFPADGLAKVADCNAAESIVAVDRLGYASFSPGGLDPGLNPCSVVIDPPPTCSITGPSSVAERTEGIVFSAQTDAPGPIFNWVAEGSAAIASASGSSVTVNAGPPGTFKVTVFISGTNRGTHCARDVRVTSDFDATCSIPCGPGNILEGALATYNAPPGYAYGWTISGNGVIEGSTSASSVQVRAGSPGSFTIGVRQTYNSIESTLYRTVRVEARDPFNSQQDAKILIHLRSVSKNPCGDAGSTPACYDVVTTGDLYPQNYRAFVLVCDGYTNGSSLSGVAGLQFGINYDGSPHSGIDILGWTLCATLEFHGDDWPGSGSGTLITWSPDLRCQNSEPGGPHTGVVANAGCFYLTAYTPDRLTITPHPVDGAAKVANCSGAESIIVAPGVTTSPYPLGFAQFSGTNLRGYNPCASATPVRAVTWSGIKTLFE